MVHEVFGIFKGFLILSWDSLSALASTNRYIFCFEVKWITNHVALSYTWLPSFLLLCLALNALREEFQELSINYLTKKNVFWMYSAILTYLLLKIGYIANEHVNNVTVLPCKFPITILLCHCTWELKINHIKEPPFSTSFVAHMYEFPYKKEN